MPPRLTSWLSFFICVPVVLAQTPTWGKRPSSSQPLGGHDLGIAYDSDAKKTLVYGSRGRSETWQWDATKWTMVATTGPSGRSYRDMVYDSVRKRTVMVTGSSDVWEWDNVKWTQRTLSPKPRVTGGYKLAFDSKRGVTVLFGGYYSGWTMADTWEYDGKSWRKLSTGGPPHRINHAMCYDSARGVVVVFGGMGIRNSNDAYYKDTWIWNGQYWREHFGVAGPNHRQWSAMAYDPKRQTAILYGGFNAVGGGTIHDTWEWNGLAWAKITTLGSPKIGGGANLAFDTVREVAVLVGGSASVGETWEYNHGGGVKASFSTYGTGCPGSAGMPSLAAGPGQVPRIGQNFTIVFANLPKNPISRVMGVAGGSRTRWGSIPLPLTLSPLGMPGCLLLASWDLPLIGMNITNGTASWTIPIPNDATLNGGTFYVQGIVLEPGVNTFGAVVTNAGSGRMGS